MALLDTLKSGISSGLKTVGSTVLGAVAPGATAVKNTASSLFSAASNQNKQAQSAASMAPVNSAPLGDYKPESKTGSLAVTGTGSLPGNVSSGQTTKTNSALVAPQMSQIPKGTIGAAPVKPPAAPTAPAPAPVNNQISGTNPFGSGYNFQPATAPQNMTLPKISDVNISKQFPTELPAKQSTTELSDLEKAILGTYSQSADEKNAQDALTRLAQQQADLSGAYRAGTNKIGEQPIVLDLLRGQQQALQKQYEGQVGALADQSKPLEVQLANLVANRELQNKALSTQYGFETAKQKAAAEAAKSAEGFTLGEGQMRYDANGNLIASGGEKTTSVPTSIQEYQYVQSQGYPGSYLDYVKAKDAAASSGGSTPTSYKEWQLSGSPGTYADWVKTSSGKAPTANQFAAAGFANRIGDTSATFDNLSGEFSKATALGGALPNFLKFENRQVFEQAERNFINATLRRESGAAIADSEFSNARQQYIPRPGDSAGVLAAKKQNRLRIQQQLQAEGAGALNQMGSQSSVTPQSLLQKGIAQSTIDAYLAQGHSLEDLAQDAGFNTASSSALNSSSIKSVKQDGQWGGQCGEFIHNIVPNYPYGLNGINQKEAIINVPKGSVPQVGDVVIQRVAGSTGHVAVVNSVDPMTGKITLTESNWNNDEKVKNTRQMSINSPTISGYFRGSLS